MALPIGLIFIWSGEVGNIPAGFSLCDGNNGTPNLVDKFIKCVPDVETDPGTESGSLEHTHTLDEYTHIGTQHIQYGKPGADGTYLATTTDYEYKHDHTGSISKEQEPSYYKVAYIMITGGAVTQIPDGVIMLWADVLGNIPSGWDLFADLYDLFSKGADADIGGSGGDSSGHTHLTNSEGGHTHGISTSLGGTGQTYLRNPSSEGAHTHTLASETMLPKYFTVAFIKADGNKAPVVKLIAMWHGTLANIPTNWKLCDGQSGRPNMLDRFIRGIPNGITDPAQTDGADEHTHTCPTAGAHTHSGISVNGDTSGDWNRIKYSHSSGGGHQHAIGNGSNKPPYYEVAFIIYELPPDLPTDKVFVLDKENNLFRIEPSDLSEEKTLDIS